MIRILHIISDLNIAGAQTVVMNYLRYLGRNPDVKMVVTLQAPPINSAYERECEMLGIEIHYLKYKKKKFIPGIDTFWGWLRIQWLHYKDIKSVDPTIVHTHVTPILRYTLFPILLAHVKHRFHTLHSDPYAIDVISSLFARIAFHLAGFYPICVTESQALKVEIKYKLHNYTIISNGIDERRFVKADKDIVRKELGINQNTFVIGCVGRLNKIKNHEFLFRLFSEYVRINPNSLLLLIGDGKEKDNLRLLAQKLNIESKILFAGIRNDVERMYYAMDVFMLTSFYESSSIVTVEAQFAGIRCIVADSIPNNVVATNLVNRIPLDAPIDKWLDAVSGKIERDAPVSSLNNFSMTNSVDALKRLYNKFLKNEKII